MPIYRGGVLISRLQAATRSLQRGDSRLGSDLVQRGASVFSRGVSVELHKLREIELGLLQHLDLSNVDILQREDGVARLLDLNSDRLGG